MPLIETPPEQETPELEADAAAAGKRASRAALSGRGRYEYLQAHELLTLIDEIDDERARARFREAVYLAVILWMALALLYIFVPRWLPHRPVLIVQERNPKELTYLDTPPNLKDLLRKQPSPRISEHSAEAETPRPTKAPTPPEPRAGHPQPPAPKPLPQAPQPQQQTQTQQPPVQQQQAPPQQVAKATPTPRPNVPPIVDAPAPSNARQPNFNNTVSASSAIANAARNSRAAGGESGDYGSAPGRSGAGQAGVQVLSDMQGVDFSKYLARLLADVRRNWIPLLPAETDAPLLKQGITGLRFTIQPNGSITGMTIDYSTHDEAINRAAWGSLKSMGAAQPLPKEFHGPNLELRIEYRVNKDRDVQ